MRSTKVWQEKLGDYGNQKQKLFQWWLGLGFWVTEIKGLYFIEAEEVIIIVIIIIIIITIVIIILIIRKVIIILIIIIMIMLQ